MLNMTIDYNKIMKDEFEKIKTQKQKPKLLLHCCCAPCSSSVIERLSELFDISLYFFNPNIYPFDEYEKRQNELLGFVEKLNKQNANNLSVIKSTYSPDQFAEIAKGFEMEVEKGERCKRCYWLRLESAATEAKLRGFDYFTTTLSVSPHKNSQWLNEIGLELSKRYDIKFLFSDFKKENGYLRSLILSKENNFYRQTYCGCIYSKKGSD
ncbi:MAG: epoxyqueuosine reductase QueH [Clostridia bacterium]